MTQSSNPLSGPTCSLCQKSFSSNAGFTTLVNKEGKAVEVCPECAQSYERTRMQETQDVPLFRAILFGAVAAAAAAYAWYGLVTLTNYKLGFAAIGVGFLVGLAVVLGSGGKRGLLLQITAGALSFLAIALGEYLIINHILQDATEGWLTFEEFFQIYSEYLAEQGFGGLLDLLFFAIAVWVGFQAPKPSPSLSKV
jgi:hypothetical protein